LISSNSSSFENLFIRLGFGFALVAGLLFIKPLDARSNTYAEKPYACNFNIHVGVGATVRFMGVDIGASGDGFFTAEYGEMQVTVVQLLA